MGCAIGLGEEPFPRELDVQMSADIELLLDVAQGSSREQAAAINMMMAEYAKSKGKTHLPLRRLHYA